MVRKAEPPCAGTEKPLIAPDYSQTRFLVSAASIRQCPPDSGCEIAFVGRSNAGKSSAINALCERRNLAKSSKTPGRTQLLNFFSVSGAGRLVDLPGYGFAKTAQHRRRQWEQLIERYLQVRRSLRGIVLVMDIRHPLKTGDVQLIQWCQAAEVQCLLLLTKSDKLSYGAARSTSLSVASELAPIEPPIVPFSAVKRQGIEPLREALERWWADPACDTAAY